MSDVLAKDRVLCASKVGSGHSNRIEDEQQPNEEDTGDGATRDVGIFIELVKPYWLARPIGYTYRVVERHVTA